MKVVILQGSPRQESNSEFFARAFADGAKENGHEVHILPIGTMKISGCLGCEFCHVRGEGKCAIHDDMQQVYPFLAEADMVVICSPIHYWSFSGQMQSAITRFYAPKKPKATKWAMILSSQSPEVYDAPVSQFNSFVDYFGSTNVGIKTFCGKNQKTEENYNEVKDFAISFK